MLICLNNKFENSLFFLYVLNKDALLNIPLKSLKFEIHIHKGPSFYFM